MKLSKTFFTLAMVGVAGVACTTSANTVSSNTASANKSIDALLPLAKQGDAEKQAQVCRHYYVEKNYQKALVWCNKSSGSREMV